MRNITVGKRWVLGFAIAIVYIPLRTFVNVKNDLLATIQHKLPLFAVEIVVSTLFFTCWISFIDWILIKLNERSENKRPVDFSLSTQLITLISAILLAFLFNRLLIFTWMNMEFWWEGRPLPFSFSINRHFSNSVQYRANQALTIMAFMSAYYLCVSNHVQENLNRALVNAQMLEKENAHANFQALKNQISPHFLFNNLSVLASLVELYPEKSGEFISQLSNVYRYILHQTELSKISLKEEIAFLETYTFLLKTRFKDKIVTKMDLTVAELNSYFLIPLTLQLLVENAIKHNTMSVTNPLVISIYTENGMLVVSNPIQKRVLDEPSTKLGLKNIVSRYDLLFRKQVTVQETAERFIVKIPMLL
jgi:two-component system LytT family sensor kinase